MKTLLRLRANRQPVLKRPDAFSGDGSRQPERRASDLSDERRSRLDGELASLQDDSARRRFFVHIVIVHFALVWRANRSKGSFFTLDQVRFQQRFAVFGLWARRVRLATTANSAI